MKYDFNEQNEAKTLLKKTESRYRNLDAEVAGLVFVIRYYLNPFCDDSTELNSKAALITMERLHKSVEELKTLKAKIKDLEAYLD